MADFTLTTTVPPVALSDDILGQIGPRVFSIRQEGGTLHFSGDLLQSEVETVLGGFAARQAEKEQAAKTDRQERDALTTLDTQLATYINTTSPTNAATVAIVKTLCRVVRYYIRRI